MSAFFCLSSVLVNPFELIRQMGNICVLGLKAVDGTLTSSGDYAGSDLAPQTTAPLPAVAVLRRTSKEAPRRVPGSSSLQELCVACVAEHFSVLCNTQPARMDQLPRDLVQQVVDELIAAGSFSPTKLARIRQPDLDSISLEPYGTEVQDEWVGVVARSSTRLRVLDLTCCDNITGEGLVYVRKLTALRTLKLAQCNKVDSNLQCLSGLRDLRHLDLGWCIGIEDPEVSHLSHLTRLTYLALSYSKVTCVGLSALKPLVQLRHLDLQGCPIEDCATLSHFSHLTHLRLDKCRMIGDAGAEHIARLHELQHLSLAYTDITDTGLSQLQVLRQLVVLDLDSCQISDDGCKHLRHLHNLRHLNLADTNVHDATLLHLSDLVALTRLSLAYTKVTDKGLAALQSLTQLQDLNLDSASISSEGLRYLSPLVALTSLDLYSARVCETGVKRLLHLTGLKRLELCGGAVTDACCPHLAKLANLTLLSLAHNNGVTDVGVRSLSAGLPALETLNLSHTHVSSGALREVMKMKSLRTLSLYGTHVPEGAVRAMSACASAIHIKPYPRS